jgi:predicted XRE-type DNA-binding protein
MSEMFPKELLERMRVMIESGIMAKSDKYHKLHPGYPIEIKEGLSGHFNITATGKSDSSIWLEVFESGEWSTPKEYLNRCSDAGAYTKTAWEYIERFPDETVEELLIRFRIRESINPLIRASAPTMKQAQEVAELLHEWAIQRDRYTDEECFANDELNFMRKSRRKKVDQGKDPACFDGLCIERNLDKILNGVTTREINW